MESHTLSTKPESSSLDGGPSLSESTVLLARQPIFDRNRRVWGYELLYRSGGANYCDENEPGGRATARVIVNCLLNIGIDTLIGAKQALINVDREMLLGDFLWTLPRDKVILEILETVVGDAEIVKVCSEARDKGFVLALDDVDERAYGSPLLDLVDIIKVDFRSASLDARQELARRYGSGRTIMLAEKVETEEEFQNALSLGYQFCQGYFFARPALVSGRPLPVATVSLLRILGQLSDPDISINRLERAVQQHVSLAVKLIRYLNSGAFRWNSPIQSLQHALTLLGTDQLRKIVSLMIIADINGSGPRELLVKALLRARMCELLSLNFGLTARSGSLFLMGLFSLIDVILRRPMEKALSELNLEDDISNALLERLPGDHPIRHLYEVVVAHELADWSSLERWTRDANVDLKKVTQCHLQALQWADEASQI